MSSGNLVAIVLSAFIALVGIMTAVLFEARLQSVPREGLEPEYDQAVNEPKPG